jgi:tetratricopeptide (TPR) repeat protein
VIDCGSPGVTLATAAGGIPEDVVRKRWRRLIILLAALLVLLGLLAGTHLWAQWHYREGQNALGRGDFAAAQQHFSQCLRVWPGSSLVHLLAARAARKAGDFDETERLLHRCRELGGDADLIELERLLVGAQRGRLAAVERQLVGRVLQDHPESVLILEVLTVAYLRTYQLHAAQECLRRWLEREPDRLEAWLLRADVAQRLNNRTEALVSYRRVLELDPGNDDARLQMAGHLAHGTDVKGALAEFEYLRKKQGDTPAVLKGLAFCWRQMNQPDEARRLLEVVLAENPRDWRALGERGRLAMQYESLPEAEKWLRQAVAAAPHEKDIYYNLCQCLKRLGKDREAEEVLAKLKRTEADLARIADLSRGISRTPHDPGLRCEAGVILLRNGLESEGLRWLQSALGVDPRHAATHRALAGYYERAGDAVRAADHREKASAATNPYLPPLPGGSR